MPLTIQQTALKYRDDNGVYHEVDCLKGDDATPELIAPDYEDLTFPVVAGTHCYHSGNLYVANQAISTSEVWTAAHWDATVVGNEIEALSNAINGKLDTPSTAGTSGQVLTSDGQGGQSWQTINPVETVSGSTPSITATSGVRYVCGEVSTLTIVVPATGIIDVVFESGSTPTVLTVTPPTGVTAIKWANGFDPTSLEANKTYELNIMDGCLGVAGSWT